MFVISLVECISSASTYSRIMAEDYNCGSITIKLNLPLPYFILKIDNLRGDWRSWYALLHCCFCPVFVFSSRSRLASTTAHCNRYELGNFFLTHTAVRKTLGVLPSCAHVWLSRAWCCYFVPSSSAKITMSDLALSLSYPSPVYEFTLSLFARHDSG